MNETDHALEREDFEVVLFKLYGEFKSAGELAGEWGVGERLTTSLTNDGWSRVVCIFGFIMPLYFCV